MNNMWAAVVEIGFLGWVGSAVGFIFRALDKDGKFIGRKALFWGGDPRRLLHPVDNWHAECVRCK